MRSVKSGRLRLQVFSIDNKWRAARLAELSLRTSHFVPPTSYFCRNDKYQFVVESKQYSLIAGAIHTRKACISLSRAAATRYRCLGSGTPAPAAHHPIAFIGTLASLCRLISRAALHRNKNDILPFGQDDIRLAPDDILPAARRYPPCGRT